MAAPGQELKALVIEAKGENRFILDISGARHAVRSEASLAPGQLLRLQLVRTEPQIELQIIPSASHPLQGRSLTLLGKNIDLAGLFQHMQQHSPPPLAAVSPASRATLETFFAMQQNGVNGEGGGSMLKQLIDRLGLNLEQLLARGDKNSAVHTLKAALLELAHSFKTAGSAAETTNRILATLELFQIAQIQIGGDNQLIFPLPLPFIEQGYLLVAQDGEDGEQNDRGATEQRFSLHLTVSELGNLQIDFLHTPEGLFIRFRAGDQQKADFLQSFGDELKKAITAIPLVSLSFSGDAPDPIHELIRKMVPESDSMLDTKV